MYKKLLTKKIVIDFTLVLGNIRPYTIIKNLQY